jgi:hypothetical protein
MDDERLAELRNERMNLLAAMVQDLRAQNDVIARATRSMQSALGVLVATLGGTVTIPAEVLAAAPPIRWETAEDGTVTITTGESNG